MFSILGHTVHRRGEVSWVSFFRTFFVRRFRRAALLIVFWGLHGIGSIMCDEKIKLECGRLRDARRVIIELLLIKSQDTVWSSCPIRRKYSRTVNRATHHCCWRKMASRYLTFIHVTQKFERVEGILATKYVHSLLLGNPLAAGL